eukprot:5639026-Prymnesium_polylepis.1
MKRKKKAKLSPGSRSHAHPEISPTRRRQPPPTPLSSGLSPISWLRGRGLYIARPTGPRLACQRARACLGTCMHSAERHRPKCIIVVAPTARTNGLLTHRATKSFVTPFSPTPPTSNWFRSGPHNPPCANTM